MIVSISRRTDLPALYPDWLMNRLREGFVLVRQPYRPHRISRVELRPEKAECLVFWSKNPAPLLPRLEEIRRMGYHFYFQFTLNPYGPPLEAGLPPPGRPAGYLPAAVRDRRAGAGDLAV